MNKRKIAIYTGNRAEYGLQLPIIRAIDSHPSLEYNLIVSGALLAVTVAFEWSVLGQDMVLMIENGYWMIGCVSAGFAFIALLLLSVGIKTLRYVKPEELTTIEEIDEAPA